MTHGTISLKKRYKYRIYPNKEQQAQLAKVFGCCRFVYNKLLADTKEAYEKSIELNNKSLRKKLDSFELHKQLTVLKGDSNYSWLYDVNAQTLQVSISNLADSYKRSFKQTKFKYPKFKSKFSIQTATFSDQSYSTMDCEVRLGKIAGWIKINRHRPLPPGKRTACTITKTPSGKYFASFIVEVKKIATPGQRFLGIDAGITDLYTFSDGTTVPNPRHFVNSQERLVRLQRQLSRKKKGSNNRNKARIKVANLHEKVANQRRDYLDKLSTRIIRENQAVCIESLRVGNMVKNRRLAKHIADAGWGIFRQMLKYKATHSTGCKLYLADPYFPSTQLCNACGRKPDEKLLLDKRKWTCFHCDTTHQRDHNAALNLLNLAKVMHSQYSSHPDSVFKCSPYVPGLV